jgi:spore coat polysaccharide biosynthesis protein SpsF
MYRIIVILPHVTGYYFIPTLHVSDMRVVCTIEARMGSTRLPGKMMKEVVDGRTTLECMVARLKKCVYSDELVVATSVEEADDVIAETAAELGVECFRGSEADVLDRIVSCAQEYDADVVCETTGDCPLIDPLVVDQAIACFLDNRDVDYVSNVLTRSWPHGMDVEVVSRDALEHVHEVTSDGPHREHVTTYIRDHPEEFDTFHLSPPPTHRDPSVRITLDYPEDLELIRAVYKRLSERGRPFDAGIDELLEVFREEPKLREINAGHSEFDADSEPGTHEV